MKSFKVVFFLMFVLLVPGMAFAANHYVRAGATGASNGTDWLNAYTNLPSTLVRGDTYYVADGSYGSYTFDDATSGTTHITIKKATTSDHGTSTGWSSTYGDGQAIFGGLLFTTNYWTIDGQTRTSVSSGHGIRINSNAKCIRLSGRSNITLRYLEMVGAGDDGDGLGNDLIYGTSSPSNITLQYSYLHDSGRTMILSRGGSNWLVEHNYFYKNESVPAEHSEQWSCGTTSNVVLRYNIFGAYEGTACIATLDSPSGPSNWEIYGNVFMNGSAGNGIITTDSESAFNDVKIFNNIIYGNAGNCGLSPYGAGSSGSGWVIYNNMFVNNTCARTPQLRNTHDYNYFFNNSFTPPSEPNREIGTGNIFVDPASLNFRLKSGTNAGFNTNSLVLGNSLDPDRVTRGGDGILDRGAYEYFPGGQPVTATPYPPQNLRIN